MAGPEAKPRVLLLGGDGALSGIPRHLTLLCETLSPGADITVLSDRDLGGYATLCSQAVRHHEVDGMRNRAGPGTLLRCWRSLRQHLDHGRWDVIWLHERRPALMLRIAMTLGLWRPSAGPRLALSYHVIPFDPGHRPLLAVLSRWLERWLLRWGPPMHLVFLTQDMILRLDKVVGNRTLARHHLHVLPNSSNVGAMPFGPGAVPRRRDMRHLVITGRAGFQKNYELAARLLAHLPQSYHLTLCGPGTNETRAQARILRGLAPDAQRRIAFAGPVSDVRPLLADADGYVLTSRYEGLPIGAIEAFEAGLPLMLSPFESAPEMVASHPMALLLTLADLDRDAARIVELVETYRQNRPAHAARIHRAWARKYPYDLWQAQARKLLMDMLRQDTARA